MNDREAKIQLLVEEAMTGDVGKCIARIDDIAMKSLNIIPGDTITITGKYSSAAIALPLHYDDYGKQIIRIDGWSRRNTGVSIGEKVALSKAEVKDADYIEIAPVKSNERFSKNAANLIKQYLQNTKIPFGEGNLLPVPMGLGIWKNFVVVKIVPQGFVMCSEYSDLNITYDSNAYLLEKKGTAKDVSYEDLGGLRDITRKVREMIELPLAYPWVFKKLGIESPKGILFYGPPGTGKTLLAKAIANETKANFVSINGPEIIDKYYGESERKLRDIFKEAEEKAPSIIFIDEIDSISPKRDTAKGDVEKRVVAQLLTLMDGLNSKNNIVVIGATNRQDDIDPALRRPGRFDREIEFSAPDTTGRKEILTIHTRGMPLSKDVDLDEISKTIHGFVGADIAALCREAAMTTLRRLEILQKIGPETNEIPVEILNNINIEKKDFLEAMKNVQPSVLRGVLIEKPNVKWNDIGGLDNVKQQLKEMIEWPLTHPESFKNIGISPPKGILLYGPPGTGKTMLAKAVATESEANFIAIKGPELLSMWIGETEKGIREIFRKARQSSPCIIFFDEFDAIASVRTSNASDNGISRTIVNQLLTEIDGMTPSNMVFTIAATNRLDIIDPAFLRPGRFGTKILVSLPDKDARKSIFEINIKKMSVAQDVNIDLLNEEADGFTGADIENLCREAGLNALRENINANVVYMKHFEEAMKKIAPSVSNNVTQYYHSIDMKIHEKKNEEQKYIA